MAEINSIFDFIFPRKKASDYQQTNLLDYGESPESQNVYNPGQGDFGVMSLEGLKNAIPSTVSGTLDFMYDSAGTLRRPDFKQVQDNVEPGDFNIYNAYAGTDKFQPFTTSFRQTGLLPTKEEEQAFRERSMGYDLGKYGGQFLLGGMGVRSATGKSLGEAMNFAIPGLTLDLEDPNIGDALDALGMDNEFQQFLQGNIDENSTAGERLKQRFTNVLGEFGINVVADTAINTLRVAKNLYKDPEYREQAIKNIGRDMYGDLPGSQLFGGVKSLGGDRSLLEVAKARYKTDGADDFNSPRAYNKRQEIWRDTGWAKGRDGKWYYEMDDSQSNITKLAVDQIGMLGEEESIAFAPKNFLDYKELWQHYPDIDYEGTVHVVPGVIDKVTGKIVLKNGSDGMTIGNNVYIPHYKGATAPDIKKTILHEYQHLIQERERFMQGGDDSLPFILKLRDQLYSEMKSQAKDPGMFGFITNLKRLHDAQQLQPTYQKIAELLSADDVEGALTMLRKTPWWSKEGGLWRKRVDYQFDMWQKANPNATELEKNDVLRTFKKMNLRGQGQFEKDSGIPPTAMTTVTDRYNKEITALKKKLAKDLKTDIKGVDDYYLDQQKQFAEKGYNTPQLFGRALDDLILQKFDPQGRKAISDYRNKFKMIRNVEDGVYNDYQSRMRVYKSLMGEGQARNVEHRMDMTAEKRREIFPEETEEFGSFQETRISGDGLPIDTLSDNQPIFVNRPAEFRKRKGKGNFNALKLIDELEQPIKTDDAGFFLRSEKILNETNKDTWKNPDEVFMEGKKGKSGLLKDVPKQELEETGVLDYLAKAKAEGTQVTKRGLLDQLEEGRPYLGKSEAYYVEDAGRNFDDYELPNNFDEFEVDKLDIEDSYNAYRGEDYAREIEDDVAGFIERNRSEYDELAETPIGIEFEALLSKLGKESFELSPNEQRIINEYAEDIAKVEYDASPEYYMTLQGDWDGAPQITVSGNENIGYRAFDENLYESIASEEYSLNETNVKIQEYLRDNYELPYQGENETFWKDYASPGYFDESTYKEINAEVSQSELQFPRNVDQHSLPGDEDRSLFFTRTTERDVNTPDDGYVTALHIDEIQSDWHQQLRKFGIDFDEAMKKGKNAEKALREMRVKQSELEQKQLDAQNDFEKSKGFTMMSDIVKDDPYLKQHEQLLSDIIFNGSGSREVTLKTFIDKVQPRLKDLVYNAVDDFNGKPKYLRGEKDVMRALEKKINKMVSKFGAPYRQVTQDLKKANAVIRKLEKFIYEAPGRTNIGDETGKQYIGVGGSKPPLANEKWEETALKMNIMDAIDRNLDYVVWTPSDVQIAQWGDASAELYKNVYDKRLPKNAKKFVNEFGGELQKGQMNYGSYKDLGERDVWIIKITPEMKKNLTKQGGMPLYQYGAPVPFGLLGMENQDNGRIDENKGLLQ